VLIRHLGREDPGLVVVDEVAGMFLTLVAAPRTWWAYAIGFVLFRVVDIVKPFPAGWCDRHLHGGLGAMLDDVAAALWSLAALWLIATYVPVERLLGAIGL
jgi:phosphatidylglycerophosphatase A